MLVFLCGRHASGKTSIRNELERQGIISFNGPEIGKRLYYKRKFSPEAQGPKFELEVAHLELERDNSLVECDGITMVETWHPGNMAYAQVRNPEILSDLKDIAEKSPFLHEAHGIWLRISNDALKERTKTFADDPEKAAKFYQQIDDSIGPCLDILKLRSRTVSIQAEGPLEEVIQAVKITIQNFSS